MPKQQQAKLSDMLGYTAETYFSPEELALIQNTFKDKRVISVLRKALLPSVGDPSLPIEEMGNDVWLTGRDYAGIPDAEIKSVVLARQEAIKFVMGALIKLKVMANSKVEDPMAEALRRSQDSSK